MAMTSIADFIHISLSFLFNPNLETSMKIPGIREKQLEKTAEKRKIIEPMVNLQL